MGNIVLCIFVLRLLHNSLQVLAFPRTTTESFVIHYLEDRRIVPVKIELNANAQTEHVKSIAGETLYDFKQGKVAYKDLNSSQCFITNIVEESLEKDRRRLKNLQNGVVRGFYLPTFLIQEELNSTTNFTENFGIILAEFCTGNTISLVIRQINRRKRDAPGEKGQFTHHSYGHYGHQSNNYAHYGHETYITGAVDENGQIRNQQVNHQQIRSQSSHVYPRPQDYRNGPQDSSRSSSDTTSRPVYRQQDLPRDSRTSADVPQTRYQTQYRTPSYQQTFGGGVRSPGMGGTGQFSLQSSHEGGYQLNLPLGLQAGNTYRGGVRSGGHYGVGGPQPHIRTEHRQYPDSISSTGHQAFDQQQPSPPVAQPVYPSTVPGIPPADMRKIPSHIQPDTSVPAVPIAGGRHVLFPTDTRTSDTQIPFATTDRRQPGIDYESQLRRQVDHRTIPGAQVIPSADDRLNLPHTHIHPPSSIADMRHQTASRQPGIGFPSIHRPSESIYSSSGIPGQISTRIPISDISDMQRATGLSRPSQDVPGQILPTIPGSDISDMQRVTGVSRPGQGLSRQISERIPSSDISDMHRVTGVSRPGYVQGTYPDLVPQQYTSRGILPEQQYLQTPDIRQPSGYRGNGDIQERPVPSLLTSGAYPSYPSSTDVDKQQVSFPGPRGSPYLTPQISHKPVGNGAQYPDATRPQTDIYTDLSRIPIDTPGTSITRMRPGETPLLTTGTGPVSSETIRDRVPTALRPGATVQDPRYNLSVPSIDSKTLTSTDRRIITGQSGSDMSRTYSQDSASSQTQIQTGLEGTAAEASAAGHYRGLGSQTQVQGGYVGNGSFSAQAQSGFTGGVVQSQVQGGKQGGLSGSSAQVERVGSAQSQVQVLQPSGSASSTAQGRFSGGTTQVQAQSSKTGGSAGAQAQSTGLSSSHVQVNIGGNDVSKDENFQGTVSASVHGGQSSGQSQTQLQGGYNSGRTYAATAQGGFDTALGFEGIVPPIGSLTNFSHGALGGQLISSTSSKEPFGTFRGGQIYGVPISGETSDITQQQALKPIVSQTDDLRASYPTSQRVDSRAPYPNLDQEPSRILPSSQTIYRGAYPGYPSEVRDRRILPTSSGDFDGYRRVDQRGVQIPGFPQTDTPGVPEQAHFGVQAPETQDRILQETRSQRYPSLPSHTLAGTTDQHYASKIPSTHSHLPSLYYPSQPSATIDSKYVQSFPSMPEQPRLPEQPGVQSRYIPAPHFPDQPQILTPGSQMIPSHRHPGQMPILTRPDGSLYLEPSQQHLSMPDQTKLQPEQSQVLLPSPQTLTGQPRPQIQPQFPPALHPRPQIPPKQTPVSQQRPQIRPEERLISSPKPQIPTTTQKIPASIPSASTETRPDRTPGVSEPDKRDCCAALRDLKRRCCGRTSKQDGSSCCRSNDDDIFDFSSEDDLDGDKQPCKVVKAICYIVYKPVGKARICKPTATNGC